MNLRTRPLTRIALLLGLAALAAGTVSAAPQSNAAFARSYVAIEKAYQPLSADENEPLGNWPKLDEWQQLKQAIDGGATNLTLHGPSENVISLAALAGRTDVLQALLARKFTAASPEFTRFMPLEKAAQRGQLSVVRLLVESARISPKGKTGRALHYAARNNHLTTVKFLLARGLKPDSLDAAGWTPLHWIATVGPTASRESLRRGDTPNGAAAALLIARGANVDAAIPSGQTPLHIATASGRVDLVKMLLQAGADPDVVDEAGQTPDKLVKSQSIAKMLLHAVALKAARKRLAALIDTATARRWRGRDSNDKAVDFYGNSKVLSWETLAASMHERDWMDERKLWRGREKSLLIINDFSFSESYWDNQPPDFASWPDLVKEQPDYTYTIIIDLAQIDPEKIELERIDRTKEQKPIIAYVTGDKFYYYITLHRLANKNAIFYQQPWDWEDMKGVSDEDWETGPRLKEQYLASKSIMFGCQDEAAGEQIVKAFADAIRLSASTP